MVALLTVASVFFDVTLQDMLGDSGRNQKDEIGDHARYSAKAFWYTFVCLLLSGFLGVTVGDNCWLQALQRIGTRRSIMMDSVKPFL